MYGIIYKLTNKANNKVYIGQTTLKLSQRLRVHKQAAAKNSTTPIANALRKYGIEGFIIEIVQECENQEVLNEAEASWITKEHCLTPNGYNIKEGGGRAPFNEEFREKLRDAHKRRDITGPNNPFYGKFHSEKVKEDSRERSRAMWASGFRIPKLSEESLAKMRASKKGKLVGKENPAAKRYLVISPNGDKYVIEGEFKKFCIEYGIRTSHRLSDVAKNRRENHNGWVCYFISKEDVTILVNSGVMYYTPQHPPEFYTSDRSANRGSSRLPNGRYS